jgi:hypothetical protein
VGFFILLGCDPNRDIRKDVFERKEPMDDDDDDDKMPNRMNKSSKYSIYAICISYFHSCDFFRM